MRRIDVFMKSKVLNEIFNKNSENADINEVIKFIKDSGKFHILDEILDDVKEDFFIFDSVHGISHNERVAVLAMAIGIRENLSDEELRVTLKSALYHDIGRKIAKGREHGIESARLIRENRDILASGFTEDEIKTLEF